jgi:hypothetical protein
MKVSAASGEITSETQPAKRNKDIEFITALDG